MSTSQRSKVAIYIDGFNLYHSINALHKPWLKWLNLMQLSQTFMRQKDDLCEIHFFTTVCTWDKGKRLRHLNYVKANEAYGVSVHHGKFKKVTKVCSRHNNRCPFREEKYTDVAIAVKMIADAHSCQFNEFVLLTADSDQVPTIRMIRDQFPAIGLTLALPPGRHTAARELGELAHRRIQIDESRLGACLLPRSVEGPDGRVLAEIPDLYVVDGCPFSN